MGTIADTLFSVLMSWVRALVNSIWALFTSEHTTLLEFLGKNWLLLALVLIGAGLLIDWLVWLVRWQPYHIWAQRVRRLLRIDDPHEEEEEEEEETERKPAAPRKASAKAKEASSDAEDWLDAHDAWLPLVPPVVNQQEEQAVMERADSVSDAELGAYPGRRYDEHAGAQEELSGTRRYAAVHSEGPGAAEVSRRRAEIDAWQRQMQEEAESRAAAQRAAYEAEQARLAQEAYEAEQARLAQEAYEAEQARIAYEAEQARLAQEQYERELAEYERQKAQYELELAEYERQKAAYDAEMARIAAEKAAQTAEQTAAGSGRTRRSSVKTSYSDYVQGEQVSELPDAPAWPKMESAQLPKKAETKQPKASRVSRVARLFEPEEEEISGVTSLPPRVDMKDAYRPAKKPGGSDGAKG